MIGWFWPDKQAAASPPREGDMAERVEPAPVLDVSKLPTVSFGTKSLTWCGIIGMMAIEGMVFVLMIASYFYLHSRSVEWPPHDNPPDAFLGHAESRCLSSQRHSQRMVSPTRAQRRPPGRADRPGHRYRSSESSILSFAISNCAISTAIGASTPMAQPSGLLMGLHVTIC